MLWMLAAVGVLEAVVYVVRYRSAVGRRAWLGGVSAFVVAALRVGFLVAGVSVAFESADPAWAVVAYAVPAGLATWASQALGDRMNGGRDAR